MQDQHFREYLYAFEKDVMLRGIEEGRWGTQQQVTIRPGRLAQYPIGRFLGTRFRHDKPVAISYYGLIKKSTEFMALAARLSQFGMSTIKAPVAEFSSVKIEDVAELAPELIQGFVDFKKHIKEHRWEN